MIRILTITSDSSKTPLAEVRTDGQRVEFVVDNTEGALPEQVQGSYEKLVALGKGSSHIRIQEAKKATVNLLRYVMDNGDVVEITSDGRTCLLNGQLIDDNQKNALFQSIRRGELKVARKADQPVPVMPTSSGTDSERKPEKLEVSARTKELMRLLAVKYQRQKSAEASYGAQSDPRINDANYDYSDDVEFSKNMARVARYGSGGPNG